jgi:hypothetical protein
MAQSNLHKVRLLESQLWNRYLADSKGGALRYRAFIYHWRKLSEDGDELRDFSSLSKFRRIMAGWRMLIYIGVVLLIGIGGNLLASKIYEKMFASPQNCQCTPPATSGKP